MVFRPDVFQTVLFEFRLQLPEIGVQVDPDVRGAEHVVFESGQRDFPGNHSAAHPVITFGHQDLEAVPDQERGADQRVMTAAGDDYIII